MCHPRFQVDPRSADRSPARVQRLGRATEFAELIALFFVQGAAMAMWAVPLSTVLDAQGLGFLRPFAFATSALAAFVAPLFFGAMADRHVAPVKVLRLLACGSSLAMAAASTGIRLGWGWPWVLGLIQIHALFSTPSWSIASTLIFSRLQDPRRQFGPIRAAATVGWMAGCWVVSALQADRSPLSGYGGAVAWLGVAGLTFLLPGGEPPASTTRVTLRERFGLDALQLLRDPNHRGVFVTAALLNIPLAAFYAHTPPHLRELGLVHTSAWMSLGQVTEILVMLTLGTLIVRWRLKTIFSIGLAFGVIRFALSAVDRTGWVLAGVTLHGCSYALVFITSQIYLEGRVDPAWRARAQALLFLMTSGVGNLAGYLGTGAWLRVCTETSGVRWTVFWGGLAAAVAAVWVFFRVNYRGRLGVEAGASAKP